jgi:polysaccharide chain length determinant protein (PEP-CTERM system associated)
MEIEQDSKTIQDYLQILCRRKYTILVPMLVLFVVSVIVALALPPIYRSAATILIEQQKIPTDLVKSTVVSPVDERIRQIQQSIMTVDNINEIIEKYQLYPTKNASRLDLAEKFRANFTFELVNVDVLGKVRNSKITLAFKLAFDHNNPLLAQKTASEITNRFLKENITSRTEGAKQTSSFLGQEAEEFKQEIEKTETKIAEYKKKYRDSLPELLPAHLDEVGRIKTQIQQTIFQEQAINAQRLNLQSQFATTSPVLLDTTGKSVLPDNLPALKAEYARLLSKYSVLHPDVIALKHRIDNYKASDNAKNAPSAATNPVYLQLKSQLEMADIQQRNLIKQRESLNQELKTVETQISQTPEVELEYADLMRDLDSNKAKYKELKEKYLEAKLSQSLEDEQRSERFSVSESAVVPTKPEKPERLKVLLMGLVASVVCGIGIGVGAEILTGGVRGQQAVTFLTGMQPLVVIPYIQNQQDIDSERKKKNRFIILCYALFIITVIVVHTLYMPLNTIFSKVLNKAVRA